MMKDVQVTFTGKNLTGNAGLIHIGRFAKKLGVQDILQESLTLERGANATYNVVEVVTMVTLGVLAGVKHMSHLAILQTDSVLRRIFKWGKFPVATTCSRIFKRFTHKHCHELSEAEDRLRKKVWGRKWLGRIILDLDSSVRGVFGCQEGAEKGYNPRKKGQRSYHPLFCFIAQTRECFHNWFRCGDAYSANGCVEFMKDCFARLPKRVWKIIVRADNAFFNGALLDVIEAHGGKYTIKVAMKGLVNLLESKTWRKMKNHEGWEVTEFLYQCSGWRRARRFVAVRHRVEVINTEGLFPVVDVRYAYCCYVTNWNWSPWGIHRHYGQRATSENWIEWCKNQMAAGSILTQDFWANSALFQVCILAYNLLVWMIWLTMKHELKEEPNTLRGWLIHAPAKCVEHGRQCVLKLSRDWWAKDRWCQLEHALVELQFA
jgi:hypothetical protein